MNTAGPVQEGRHKESRYQYRYFFCRKNISHYPVNGHGTEKCQERIKDYIDIIVAEAENIEDGQDFDKNISLQIVPIRLVRGKEIFKTTLVRVVEEVGEIICRIGLKEMIF